MNKKSWKIDKIAKDFIITLRARFLGYTKIARAVFKKFNVSVSDEAIRQICNTKRNRDRIIEIRMALLYEDPMAWGFYITKERRNLYKNTENENLKRALLNDADREKIKQDVGNQETDNTEFVDEKEE